MKSPRTPHQELTTPDNEKVLGTLTSKGWSRLSRALRRAAYYGNQVGSDILHDALQMSGAIGGKHREDLREVLQGARQPTLPLMVQNEAPEKNGMEKRRL